MHFNFSDEATLVRDGREIRLLYMQSGDAVFAKYDADIEEGDAFSSSAIPGEYYIKKITLNRAPGNHRDGMNHCQIKLMTKKEWERLQKPADPNISQTFNIGSAAAVAGRDVNGPAAYSVASIEQIFNHLERRIKEDPTIPEEEKKTTIAKIRDFIATPRIGEFLGNILKGCIS